MKIILQDIDKYILRFNKGEAILSGIANFMAAQNITACFFNGIGSAASAELGFYNPHLKEYRKKPFVEDLEIISLTGNGAIFDADKKPIIHAHGLFSRIEFTTIAGHVFETVAAATCEISLTKLNGAMARKHNEEFNLKLLD